jgi:hypothetical protein
MRGTLVPHYGVSHQMVFKHYNRIVGNRPDATITFNRPLGGGGGPNITARGATIGRPRGSYSTGRGSYAGRGGGGGTYTGRGGGGMYAGRGGTYTGRGGVTFTGRGGGATYTGRGGGRFNPVANVPCLVCEEMVSPETMVFHLAHKHFQVHKILILVFLDIGKIVSM